jgi:hypothetical protein
MSIDAPSLDSAIAMEDRNPDPRHAGERHSRGRLGVSRQTPTLVHGFLRQARE